MGITVSNTLSSLVSPHMLEPGTQGLAALPPVPENFSAVLNGQLVSLANAAAGTQASQGGQTQLDVLTNAGAPGLKPNRPVVLTTSLTDASSGTTPGALSELIKPTASQEETASNGLLPAPNSAATTKDKGTPGTALTAIEAAQPSDIATAELAALAMRQALPVSDELAVNRKMTQKSESTDGVLSQTPSDPALPPGIETLLSAAPWMVHDSRSPRLEPSGQRPARGTPELSEAAAFANLQNLAAVPPPATGTVAAARSAETGSSPGRTAAITISPQALRDSVQQPLFATQLSAKPLASGALASAPDSAFGAALKEFSSPQSQLADLLSPRASSARAQATDPSTGLARLASGNATSTPLPEPAIVAAGTQFGDILPGTATQAISAPAPNQAAAPPTPTPITVPVQTPQWGQELGDRVVWMAKHDQQTAQINITPAQLGPIQISISLNGDQATAMFASPYPEVRQAIQESLHNLRETFAAAGINLGQSNVGAQLPQQQQEAARQFANANRSTGETDILRPDTQASTPRAGLPIQRGRGLVDLFA